ncbi:MAG: AAA family ATPase [Chitinophagales bacterium]
MFRIEYLNLKGHHQLGDLELYLSEENELKNISKPYTSVIIGPNGTGKSFILRTIAEIFRQFKGYSETERSEINLSFNFHLRYTFYHNSFEIISRKQKNSSRREYLFFKNRPFTDIDFSEITTENTDQYYFTQHSELEFPEKLLVNSVMLTDRFIWKDSSPGDFYQYLGARSTSSTSSTKSSSRRTINHIFNASSTNNDFLVNLAELLQLLGFEKSFKVQYRTKIHKLFFSGKLTEDDFRTYFENWWDEGFIYTTRKKDNPIWSIPYYNNHFKYNEIETNKLIAFLNAISLTDSGLEHIKNSSSKHLTIDLFGNIADETFLTYVRHLENLDIINLKGIKLNKLNSSLSVTDLSSGEYHLLISLIGMFANISKDSLILIDEPEISLHPNWQMRYISFLKNVFSKFADCHFILTTHSHFLVSDLEGKSSSVTALSRDAKSNALKAELLNLNTYGWSAEEVLLKVFKVATSRNYYIAEKLGILLDFIASEDSTSQMIKDKFYELKLDNLVGLTDEDPLKTVYDTIIKEYVS